MIGLEMETHESRSRAPIERIRDVDEDEVKGGRPPGTDGSDWCGPPTNETSRWPQRSHFQLAVLALSCNLFTVASGQ